MQQIKSALFSLDHNDLLKGLLVAVLAAVFTFLANAFQAPGFAFSGMNWGLVFQIGFMAGISYLGKNLLTTQSGSVLGMPLN